MRHFTKHLINEGNRIIAFWMGWDNSTAQPQYHQSWDSLMPVVEKIAQFEYKDDDTDGVWTGGRAPETAFPRTFGMRDEEGWWMVRFNRHALFTGETLIEATWLAVLDFIKWHNNHAT